MNFDYQKKKIYMTNKGSIVNKNSHDGDRFSLLSPQDETHDIGNAAFKIRDILNAFKNRFLFLTNYQFAQQESILKYFINPSLKDFKIYL
jgi:hypothetical protein